MDEPSHATEHIPRPELLVISERQEAVCWVTPRGMTKRRAMRRLGGRRRMGHGVALADIGLVAGLRCGISGPRPSRYAQAALEVHIRHLDHTFGAKPVHAISA